MADSGCTCLSGASSFSDRISMARAGTSVVTGKLDVKKSAIWEVLLDISGCPSEEHEIIFTEIDIQ